MIRQIDQASGAKRAGTDLKTSAVRAAKPTDLSAIFEIEKASFNSPWPKEVFVAELFQEKWSRMVVLESENRIVGFMAYWVMLDKLYLSNIAISPEFRSKGLSRKMIDHLITDGRKNGGQAVFLEVRVSNLVAIKLYRSYGFEILKIRKRYYPDNDEDALIMRLELEK